MIWLIIIMSGLITFAMRFVFLTPIMPATLSAPMTTAMRLVPIAVLWTIIVAEIFLAGPAIADVSSTTRIIAALGAGLIAWRTKSVVMTIGIGLPLLWLANLFVA